MKRNIGEAGMGAAITTGVLALCGIAHNPGSYAAVIVGFGLYAWGCCAGIKRA